MERSYPLFASFLFFTLFLSPAKAQDGVGCPFPQEDLKLPPIQASSCSTREVSRPLEDTLDSLDFFLQERAALGHPTSLGVERLPKKIQPAHLLNYAQALESSVENGNKAEMTSNDHTDDCVHSIESIPWLKEALEKVKPSFKMESFVMGVKDSDKGKLKSYQDLLTVEDLPPKKSSLKEKFLHDSTIAKSDLLFRTLTNNFGDPAGAPHALKRTLDALSEILPRGENGETLFPLNGSGRKASDLRTIFRKNPMLPKYFHELPGISDAILAFQSGKIDKNHFQSQVAVALFHNGPKAGFWDFFSDFTMKLSFVNGTATVTDPPNVCLRPEAGIFFNTPYQPYQKEDQSWTLNYPDPLTPEAHLHRVLDRLSQGSKGGIIKIGHELGGGKMPSKTIAAELVTVVTSNTLKQFELLLKELENSSSSTLPPSWQKDILRPLLTSGKERLEKLGERLKGTFSVQPDGSILTQGQDVPKTCKDKYEFDEAQEGSRTKLDDFRACVHSWLEQEEKEFGDPMRNLGQ